MIDMVSQLSVIFYFKLLGCISGCLEESQYSLPQRGIQSPLLGEGSLGAQPESCQCLLLPFNLLDPTPSKTSCSGTLQSWTGCRPKPSRLTLWLNEHLLSNRYWRHLFLFLQLRSGLSEQFLLHLKEKNTNSNCFKFFPFFIPSIKGKKNKNKANNGIGPPCGLGTSTPKSALKTSEITN